MTIIPTKPVQPTVKKFKISDFRLIFFSVVAVLVWSYATMKIFVFDIDRWLVSKTFPEYTWILNLKFIGVLLLFAIISIFAKLLKLWRWFFYVLFFPIIVVTFYFPLLLYTTGSLNLAFFSLFSLIGFFRNFKYNIILASSTAIGFALALLGRSETTLFSSIGILLLVLIWIFLSKTFAAVRPGDAFKTFRNLLGIVQGYVVKEVEKDQRYTQLSVISPEDALAKAAIGNIEMAVATNRIFLFSAKSLKKYQISGIPTITAVFSTVFLFLIATFFFAAMYGALYKISHDNFEEVVHPSYFTFFALSFKSMIFSSISELTPSSQAAQGLNIAQNFSFIFIGVIFVSIIVAGRNQSLLNQIEETIRKAERDGLIIERYMLGRYQLNSMNDLLEELRRLKTGLFNIIDYITKRLDA